MTRPSITAKSRPAFWVLSNKPRKVVIFVKTPNMKRLSILLSLLFGGFLYAQDPTETQKIDHFLNEWHAAAAKGDADTYFGSMTPDGIYIGTDATENWKLETFRAFAKPYFDRGRAWDFKPVERHIYFSPDRNTAWFDEVLDTWMKLCRGSGVLLRQKDGSWKIAHYVLSMTVPNDDVQAVIKAKSATEDQQLKALRR